MIASLPRGFARSLPRGRCFRRHGQASSAGSSAGHFGFQDRLFSETKFGSLEFLGGLEMVSSRPRSSARCSSIRFRPDEKHFVVVLDTGHWLTGSIERDPQGRLSGLVGRRDHADEEPRRAQTFEGKGHMDAEGLALDGDRVLVSFEQDHRVEIYPDPGFENSRSMRSILPILVPRQDRCDPTVASRRWPWRRPDSPLKGGDGHRRGTRAST